MTRSNLPMAKITPTSALRKSPIVGVPPLLTRVTWWKKRPVAPHGVDDAGAHQVECVDGAEQRDDHDGAENSVAVGSEYAFGGQAEGKIVSGDLVHGQDVENRGVDQQVDDKERAEAGKNGTGDQVTGILDFITKVDDTVPTVVGVDRRLHTQQQPSNQHGTSGKGDGRNADGFECAGWPMVKQAATMTKKARPFQKRGEVLDLAAHADAFPLQQREKNDNGDAGDFDAQRGVQDRKEMRGVFAEHDAYGARGAAGGDPIAPADDEASVIAEGATREIVLAAAGGNQRTEFGELESADKGIKRAANPDADKEPGIGEKRGNVAGSADDADGDGIADRDCDAEADAENLEKFAFVLAVGKMDG